MIQKDQKALKCVVKISLKFQNLRKVGFTRINKGAGPQRPHKWPPYIILKRPCRHSGGFSAQEIYTKCDRTSIQLRVWQSMGCGAEVVVCWNLRGTRSSGSGRSSGGELRQWDRHSTGSTDLGCTINISKGALCVDITFGNSFAESPCSRFKLPLATCGSEKQATGWRLGECAPVISCSFD